MKKISVIINFNKESRVRIIDTPKMFKMFICDPKDYPKDYDVNLDSGDSK
jgi:hypothetical protein